MTSGLSPPMTLRQRAQNDGVCSKRGVHSALCGMYSHRREHRAGVVVVEILRRPHSSTYHAKWDSSSVLFCGAYKAGCHFSFVFLQARRFLWNCILDMLREGRSVTLTSHSLEECENLCTKIAIMVNGRFQCIGSLQHLKSRFGFGYSVIIRCGPASVDKVCEFMETSFPGARMQEKHYNTVQYRIPLRGIKLSQIFGAIERNRALLEIEDASVNQTNLEDIFIEFAKHQTDLAADEVLPDEQDLIVETSVDTRAYDASSVTGSLVTADSSLSDGRLTRSDGYSFVSKSTPRISDPLLPPPVISPLHPESTIV